MGESSKDQVLFEIDDRPYKAALDLAKASVEVAKAALVKAQGEYDIGLLVQKQSKDAISVQELTRRLGARDEAKANVDRAKAVAGQRATELRLVQGRARPSTARSAAICSRSEIWSTPTRRS